MIAKIVSGDVELITIEMTSATRIVDLAGWTDTWFAEHGSVLNLAVLSRPWSTRGPYGGVTVRAKVQRDVDGSGIFTLHAPDVGLDQSFRSGENNWDLNNLLHAAIYSSGILAGIDMDVEVRSSVPPGASMGTSAAVSAILAALLEFLRRGEIDAAWVARHAHETETRIMSIECGVQDQAAAAHSNGAMIVDIYRYPNFSCYPIPLTADMVKRLEDGLVTVVYGVPHRSSDVHKLVIEELQRNGRLDPRLEALRLLPSEGRCCLMTGDLGAFGLVMKRNTECQRNLHPQLISGDCDTLIDIADSVHALGWKVNGAGGPDGGSLSVLTRDAEARDKFATEVRRKLPNCKILEHRLAFGGIRPVVSYN